MKEAHVAERIRLDASLFPLRLVILADSLLQISLKNRDEPRACALGCKYFVNGE